MIARPSLFTFERSARALRNRAPAMLAVIALCWSLAGCQSEPAGPATHTDDLGRAVEVPAPVGRVVTLAPNLTEIVFAAGAGDKLVGVTTADDFPPAVDSLPAFSALPIDFEAITALEPDLVLATDQVNTPRDAETFSALDLPMYFFSFGSLRDVWASIRTTGDLLGTPRAATATVDSLQATVEALRARTASLAERPRVLVLIGDETLYSFGASSYVHTLVELAGGQSLTATLDTEAPVLSEEYVLTNEPDVIVGAFGADYDTSRLLALHPTWDVVPAIQNDRVYSLNPALLLRPGPRLIQGARQMAQALHPDRFAAAPPDSVAIP